MCVRICANLAGSDVETGLDLTPACDPGGKGTPTVPIQNLDKVFRPRNIAVIGAGAKRASVGQTVLSNLIAAGCCRIWQWSCRR